MSTLRVAAVFLLAVMLSGCGDLGQKQHSILGDNVPGIGDLGAPTKEEKADEAWWGHFYGQKSEE